jgi:hypothetical protein
MEVMYCKYCYEDQEVTRGDGIVQCTVCEHGLAIDEKSETEFLIEHGYKVSQ